MPQSIRLESASGAGWQVRPRRTCGHRIGARIPDADGRDEPSTRLRISPGGKDRDLRHDLHLVTHDDAANVEVLVPMEAERLPVDDAPGGVDGSPFAIGPVRRIADLHLCANLDVMDDAVQAQASLNYDLPVWEVYVRAPEFGARKLRYVQELAGSDLGISLRIVSRDAGQVDPNLNARKPRLSEIHKQRSPPTLKTTSDLLDHDVP